VQQPITLLHDAHHPHVAELHHSNTPTEIRTNAIGPDSNCNSVLLSVACLISIAAAGARVVDLNWAKTASLGHRAQCRSWEWCRWPLLHECTAASHMTIQQHHTHHLIRPCTSVARCKHTPPRTRRPNKAGVLFPAQAIPSVHAHILSKPALTAIRNNHSHPSLNLLHHHSAAR
jgi:hypothetical protein